MHSIVLAVRVLLLLPVLVAAAGCGPRASGPERRPVTGHVTLNGAAVENASVQFTPAVADSSTAGGQASTDAEGRFAITAYLDNGRTTVEGLPDGEYRVTVVKLEAPAGDASLAKPPKNTLPARYEAPETSGLTATVTPEGENHFEFSLKPGN